MVEVKKEKTHCFKIADKQINGIWFDRNGSKKIGLTGNFTRNAEALENQREDLQKIMWTSNNLNFSD